jgi:hypothetical protein
LPAPAHASTATLEREHLQPRVGQFLREDAGRPSESNQYHVDRRQP